MHEFKEDLLVFISVPLYGLIIGFELLYSYLKNKNLYTTKGLLANIYLTSLNMGLDILIRGVCLLVLTVFYEKRFASWEGSMVVYWAVLVIAEDFMYYWLHRVDHFCRFFWAVHVTHHSSEEFNFTVGFRSSVFQPLYRFIYFIPLALAGFKGIDIMFVYSATQIFGILAHTQTVGRLGLLEYIFITPSHHRVHHGSNVRYLDKNMGMLFVFWDKLFGTFQAEEDHDPVKYGLTENIKTYHPFKMVFHEWKNILADLKKPSSFGDKLRYVFGPPGWSHDGSKKTSGQLRKELKMKGFK
ncbi:MAG TPA: sterol desaturase family protein [Bacteroidia bacterium]|mgnify:CR=1 FL=1|nr:sterol desaturase family protein [Bacteroidia bacterium]